MQKIMFNDKYNLTELVLEGEKRQTRRLVSKELVDETFEQVYKFATETEDLPTLLNLMNHLTSDSKYKINEEVAIAQSYKTINDGMEWSLDKISFCGKYCETAGWNNKMFVKADLMPYHLKITNLGIERLQEISDSDCLKEGIADIREGCKATQYGYVCDGEYKLFDTPREAFASLIDKVSGKGTWVSNPYVFIYGLELMF